MKKIEILDLEDEIATLEISVSLLMVFSLKIQQF